jgi:hypothetical protein
MKVMTIVRRSILPSSWLDDAGVHPLVDAAHTLKYASDDSVRTSRVIERAPMQAAGHVGGGSWIENAGRAGRVRRRAALLHRAPGASIVAGRSSRVRSLQRWSGSQLWLPHRRRAVIL